MQLLQEGQNIAIILPFQIDFVFLQAKYERRTEINQYKTNYAYT